MNKTFAPLLRVLLVATFFASTLPASAATRSAESRAPVSSTIDACSWDRPGADPFMGDVVSAVDRYQDIPADVRDRLKARMAKRDYDDVVSIRRDGITGRAKARYGSAIRDMHFGDHKLCHTVSRNKWSEQTQERGLVYCDSRQCILVPTVCRNVSRITRAEVANEHAGAEFGEPLIPPVATIEGAPVPLLPDAPVAPFAVAGEATADNSGFGGYVGWFGPGSGGVLGSFASAVGGGSAGSTGPGPGNSDRISSSPPLPETGAAVTPVPEPETWGLMLGGGVALLAALRRRRSVP